MSGLEGSQYFDTPITGEANLKSGMKWDDDGYDELPVVESGEKMVDLETYMREHGLTTMKFHPVYAGFDAVTGEADPSQALPGTNGKKMYARESMAAGLSESQRIFEKLGMGYVFTDIYRDPVTQASGHVRTIMQELNKQGIKELPSVRSMFAAGMVAKVFFSPVNVNTASPLYTEFVNDLKSMAPFMQELDFAVREYNKMSGKNISLEDGLALYAKFCVNIEYVRNHYPDAPTTALNVSPGVDYENGTHPSGGSFDALVHRDGVVATPSGFDFFEAEGGMLALENMTYEQLLQRYCTVPELRDHCKKQFKIEPEQLKRHHYDLMKGAMRAYYHVTEKTGATHYEGEFQHKQYGNIVLSGDTGEVIHKGLWADKYPNAGGSPHSIQTMTRESAVAIWGGVHAKEEAARLAAE
ncbi:MAG: hypothetical protein WC101_00435 [Candidatus Gracilibacteria bacterium]